MIDRFLMSVWERVSFPARWLRWRSSGWSTGGDRAFHDNLFQAAAYDPFSESYPGYITIRRFADHAAAHLSGMRRVVDLGCGPGEITCELARRFPAIQFTGIDHSDVALARGREHAGRLGLTNLAFVRGDLETYTPEPGTDLVMMMDAFHHVLEPQRFLARVRAICPRIFLIEPAGEWTGRWDRRGDLDWLPATLLQIRERLEAQFALTDGAVTAPGGAPPPMSDAAAPTEHRYTLADFQRFFDGFGVELRGTIAGLELYGARPYDTSPLRDAFGRLTYDTIVSIEDLLYAQGVDLAAKHWAIFAERGGTSTWPQARLRRATTHAQPAAGLLPAYALEAGPVVMLSPAMRGASFEVQVRLRNSGWLAWDSQATPPVMASYHWADSTGHITHFDGIRTALPAVVQQGQDVELTLAVMAPPEPGRHHLLIDLVHEQTTWFSAEGGVIAPIAVDVG